MDSMSEGLISFKLPSIKGKPSTTYRGSLLAEIEPEPRTRTVGDAPGLLFVNTATPEDFPCNDSNGLDATEAMMASLFNWVAEPVKSLFFIVP